MKLSKAIEIIEDLRHFPCPTLPADTIDAFNLAIGCIKFRMSMKDQWAFSAYEKLIGEDSESEPPLTR